MKSKKERTHRVVESTERDGVRWVSDNLTLEDAQELADMLRDANSEHDGLFFRVENCDPMLVEFE